MRMSHHLRAGFPFLFIFIASVILSCAPGGCASQPKPGPVTPADPSSSDAPDATALSLSARDPASEPVPPARPNRQGTDKGSTTPAPAIIYTCPMHPEVVSDKPGRCPKCGMKLVVKEHT